MTDRVADFFAFARERHAIYLRKDRSLSLPLTKDPILASYRFTNVFRQLDKTTKWYTENVRMKLPPEQMLLATVVFRWFNRIRTGEAIFERDDLMGGWTAWQQLMAGDSLSVLREAILRWCDQGPYVTGAYIIKTPDGYDKLSGVLKCIEWFMEGDWREFNLTPDSKPQPLEDTWRWLKTFPFLGDFMAYEIVTDLRWCKLWDQAPDIMTWANPGPGATRGLGRILGTGKDSWNQHRHKDHLIRMMQGLLQDSRDAGYWPQRTTPGMHQVLYTMNCDYDVRFQDEGDWPAWEMRDVEHTLCEFDKYERVRTGEGRPRGTYP